MSDDNNINNEGTTTTTTTEIKKPSSQLLAESIAPWRTLRLFLYTSLGSGAALGGFLTLTGTLAVLSGARSDLDLPTQYLNLGIDFGAVALFAVLGKLDLDKGKELNVQVEEKIKRTKDNRSLRKGMKEREAALGSLELDLRVDVDGGVQRGTVSAVQSGAKQHVIIVAGPRKAVRDALLGANILKMEFALRDVLVVPYELGKKRRKDKEEEGKLTRPDGTGFDADKRPTWETQPYVADAVGDDWETYINAEMEDAVKQNGEKVKEVGIAIMVANTGEIIRRGVGQVPWRDAVEELEQKVKEDGPVNLGFLSEP